MSTKANVIAIESLEALRTALIRYRSIAQGALRDAEAKLNKERARLQESLADWQRELRRRQNELEEAQKELKACMACVSCNPQTGSRSVPDCNRPKAAVVRAQNQVKEAEQELRTVREQMGKVEEAANSYLQKARQLTRTLDSELLKCTALLSRSRSILDQYMARAPYLPKGRRSYDNDYHVLNGKNIEDLNVIRLQGINPPANIGGREYSGHAIDEMQSSGIPPSVVENTIQTGRSWVQDNGRTAHYDSINDITVITEGHDVITTFYGLLKADK